LTQALADFDNLRRVLTAPHLQNSSAQAALKQEITSATQHARKAANTYDRQVRIGDKLRAGGCEGVVVFDVDSLK
jgi:hypothetical protein